MTPRWLEPPPDPLELLRTRKTAPKGAKSSKRLLDVLDEPPPPNRKARRSGQASKPILMEAKTRIMSKVEREVIRWLWFGRIPFAKPMVLEGDPDFGKSTVAVDLAARTTNGSLMPDGTKSDRYGNVLIMSAEDAAGDTIRPRLEAAGADLSKVIVLDAVKVTKSDGTTEEIPAVLPDHFDVLRKLIVDNEIVLVIIDMLMAYLSDAVDSHKDQEMRKEILTPLGKIAEETGCAIICVRHLTKSDRGGKLVYRGQGSIAIIGQARAGLMVVDDPDDPDGNRRLLLPHKLNVAAKGKAWRFEVIENPIYNCSQIKWLGASDYTERSLAIASKQAESDGDSMDEKSRLADARQWLRVMLKPDGMEVQDVKAEAKEAGFSWRTLERAKAVENVWTEHKGKVGTDGQTYVWHLPADPSPDSAK